ncbi:hypothetical protein SNE40_005136 [Patella caerulea]|uniref:Uncharacterized protein n=1 Tax=Patella caerulea TaxID=87958 RepID=A0AAN8K6Z4_PATCE
MDYLIENREDASSVLGKYTILENLRTEYTFCYKDCLWKYQKLPASGRVRENLRKEEAFCYRKYQKLPAIGQSAYIPSLDLHTEN